MAQTVNVHEAKTHLSRLLARVESGEEPSELVTRHFPADLEPERRGEAS